MLFRMEWFDQFDAHTIPIVDITIATVYNPL